MTTLISPDEFANMHRDMSIEEIARVRDGLMRDIRHYEKLKRSSKAEDILELTQMESCHPVNFPPSMQYEHDLSCLSAICGLMAEKWDEQLLEEEDYS